MANQDTTQSAADRVIALEAELEAAGEATLSGDPLAQSRAAGFLDTPAPAWAGPG